MTFKGNTFVCYWLGGGGNVSVTVRDLGIRHRLFGGRLFDVYTTQFKFDGRTHYSRTPRDVADQSGDVFGFRSIADRAVLESFGIGGI
jgi:hypothetical protein